MTFRPRPLGAFLSTDAPPPRTPPPPAPPRETLAGRHRALITAHLRKGPATLRELATALGVTPSRVNDAVYPMLRRGLLQKVGTRERADGPAYGRDSEYVYALPDPAPPPPDPPDEDEAPAPVPPPQPPPGPDPPARHPWAPAIRPTRTR